MKVPLTDVAIEHGLTYQQAHARALTGEFGRVVRDGRRLFVVREGHAGEDGKGLDECAGQDGAEPPKAA